MTNPKVTKIGRLFGGGTRYLFVGGDMADRWQPTDGRVAWCEMTIYDDRHVGSFGGEVWPPAWPHLFESAKPTAQVPCCITATDECRKLLEEAPLHECESEHTPDGNGAYCRWCGETLA